MTVEEVNEKKRDGDLTERGYRLRRIYDVRFSTGHTWQDAHYDCFTASAGGTSIPGYGDEHPQRSGAYCINVTPAIRTRPVYKVTATYEEREEQPTLDPTNESATVRWGQRRYTEVVKEDINGDPVQNSAGEWFEEPIEIELSVPQVTITRNVSTFDPEEADYFTDTVNKSDVTIAGGTVNALHAKVDSWTAAERTRAGTTYWEETIKISLKRDDWDIALLDQGRRAIDATTGKLGPIYRTYEESADVDGVIAAYSGGGTPNTTPVQDPVKLDGDGHVYTEGLGTTKAVFTTLKVYERRDFWRLDLPTEA